MNKFHAKAVTVEGMRFASQAEARRYGELKLLQRAGAITHLECQPQFKFIVNDRPVLIRSAGYPNGRQASYRADFSYYENGVWTVEDVKGGKGTRTEAYALRRALVEAMFPSIKIVEVMA